MDPSTNTSICRSGPFTEKGGFSTNLEHPSGFAKKKKKSENVGGVKPPKQRYIVYTYADIASLLELLLEWREGLGLGGQLPL